MGAGRVMVVHSPHPVGQPGSADFKKDKFDPRILLHDAAAHQCHTADHQVEGHAHHMNVKIGILETLLTGAVEASRNPVHTYGNSQLIGLAEKRSKKRIV